MSFTDRSVVRLHRGFRFLLTASEDTDSYAAPSLDDSAWESVTVPHDWVIGRELPSAAAACGWYRYTLPLSEAARGRRLSLVFDGILVESEVYINGLPAATHKNGHTSFAVDITPYVVFGEDNLIAVKVTADHDDALPYAGGGLCRNVYLVTRAEASLAWCGIRTEIQNVSHESADLTIRLFTEGAPDTFEIELCGPDGGSVLAGRGRILENLGHYRVRVEAPTLWAPDNPALYTLWVRIYREGRRTDSDCVTIGFHACRFDPEEGFLLNHIPTQLHGVCLHGDLGVFGAAVNLSSLRRRLSLLRDMGVNALRVVGAPPAPELLDLCDRMGIMVIDALPFAWRASEEVIAAAVGRDLNHPSVILYDLGDRIPREGVASARQGVAVCRREDPSRPVTAVLDPAALTEPNGLAEVMDIIGLEDAPYRQGLPARYPEKVFFRAKAAPLLLPRGEYELSPDRCEPAPLSSLAGDFVWSGFDYLTASPCAEGRVGCTAYGILDTAGLPKGRYYLYKSLWTSDNVLAIAPHWNFDGMEGTPIDIHIFTNYRKVELYLNGGSLGVRERAVEASDADEPCDSLPCHIVYPAVPYAPGELVAVARGEQGEELARTRVKTAGKPYALRLAPETKVISADGEEACFIRTQVVDRYGYPCPTAACAVRFHVEGAGRLYATDSGDPGDTEGVFSPVRTTLNGCCVAVIKAYPDAEGNIDIYAEGEGLVSAAATVVSSAEL